MIKSYKWMGWIGMGMEISGYKHLFWEAPLCSAKNRWELFWNWANKREQADTRKTADLTLHILWLQAVPQLCIISDNHWENVSENHRNALLNSWSKNQWKQLKSEICFQVSNLYIAVLCLSVLWGHFPWFLLLCLIVVLGRFSRVCGYRCRWYTTINMFLGKPPLLYNLDTNGDFWDLRPFRHLIRVISGQKKT